RGVSAARRPTDQRGGSRSPSLHNYSSATTSRVACRGERAVFPDLDRGHAAEEQVSLPPADDGIAGGFELVRRPRILAMRDAGLDVHPRRSDGFLHAKPTRRDIRHDLEDRSMEPRAARRTDDEPRPAVALP